jgi:fengycin family lipopeptide synthetase D
MNPEESAVAFLRIISLENIDQIIISRGGDIHALMRQRDRQAKAKLKQAGENDKAKDTDAAIRSRGHLSTTYLPPTNPAQQTLCKIWQDFFHRDQVGIDDDFFELGGDSLRVIQLLARINEIFKEEISLPQLFKNPTIRDLSTLIVEKHCRNFQESPYLLLNERKERIIFCFPPSSGVGFSYTGLASYLKEYSLCSFNFIKGNNYKKYIEIITGFSAPGPYVLFGYSFGGNLAFEVGKELEKQGHRAADVIMLDTVKKTKIRQLSAAEKANILELHLSGIRDFIKSFAVEFLEDAVVERVKEYMEYRLPLVNAGKIHANIHLILEDRKTHPDEIEFRYCNQEDQCHQWQDSTYNDLLIYQGAGKHEEMITTTSFEKNATIIKNILDNIYTAHTTTQAPKPPQT